MNVTITAEQQFVAEGCAILIISIVPACLREHRNIDGNSVSKGFYGEGGGEETC